MVGLKNIHSSLPLLFTLVLAILVFLMLSGGLLLVFTILSRKRHLSFPQTERSRRKGPFPFHDPDGKVDRGVEGKVQQSFVELNNHLVRSNNRTRPHRLLILLPHCIQDFECQIKITGNIKNCKGCGKCEIKDLVELSDAISGEDRGGHRRNPGKKNHRRKQTGGDRGRGL